MLSSVALNMSANLEGPAVAQDWKRSILIPLPKKGSTKECSNHQIVVFISHADVQPGFRKGRGTRGQCANIHWIIEKAREFQINIYFCFIDNAKAFDCVDHKKLWKILKEMGIPDQPLTCLLRNLYADQEATVRTGRGTTDWFQIGKGGRQGCILSPCLFNFLYWAGGSTSWNQDCREKYQ